MKKRQMDFFDSQQKQFGSAKVYGGFGGTSIKGNARVRRPFNRKLCNHIVLKSAKARGERSFLAGTHRERVEGIVRKTAQRFQVKLYKYVNVGNHMHLLIQSPARENQANFLRVVSALISRYVMGAHRGSGMVERFWDSLPYSQLVTWGRQMNHTLNYLALNSLEAIGFSKRSAQKFLDKFSTA